MVDGNSGGNFEGGAPVVATAPTPSPADVPTNTQSEVAAQTPEELKKQARDESWARGEIPDEVLENGKGGSPADAKHSLRLRRPRAGYSEEDGVVYATLNPSALQANDKSLYDEAVAHGLISIKKGVEGVDVYSEFGGSSEYSDFATAEAQKTNGRTIRLEKDRGYIPEKTTGKETVTAEMIAHAYESWKANKKVQDLLQKAIDAQNTDTQPTSDTQQPAATAADSQPVEPQTADAGQNTQEEARKKAEELADQIAEAQKAAEATQKKVEEDNEKLKKIKQENKIINDVEALNLLNAIETYSLQEKDLREKLKTVSAEGKNDLEEQLSEVRRQKAEVMLTAIGYSEKDATIILSRKNNLDSDLALFLHLAKHTSLSKEQNSPNIAELNRVVKTELLQSITDLLNKDKPEGGKQTFEQVRMMKAGEALRAAMKALGFDEETQDKKVKELFESANSSERKLNASEDDPLHTMIEALVSGKAHTKENLEEWIRAQYAEIQKNGGGITELNTFIKEKLLRSKFYESSLAFGAFVGKIIEENFDFGAFMELIILGDGHASLAKDFGYKTREQLKVEGKRPVDIDEVDRFLNRTQNRAEDARQLICAGLHDIIPDGKQHQFLTEPDPVKLLQSEDFIAAMKYAFSKDLHEKFTENLLKKMEYGDKDQQTREKIELTRDAIVYIMTLPEFAKKGKLNNGMDKSKGIVQEETTLNKEKNGKITP